MGFAAAHARRVAEQVGRGPLAHQAVILVDGVNANRTPALNQFALSASQLVRYQYDNLGNILVQKLGGWSRFVASQTPAPVRALWGWEDTNAVAHLAFGTQDIGNTGQAQLGVATNGSIQNITPTTTTDNVTPAASTTMGSPTVTITDATTTGISSFDSVYIETHVAVGGLVLFGLYAATQVSTDNYDITATDVLGNPLGASSTSTTTTVAKFTTTSGSNVVTVELANHGYSVGSTYPVLVATTVGGVTFYGNYLVQSVVDANDFTILAAQVATSSTSGYINGGDARYLYSFGVGAVPAGSGYGVGGYGRGGYGSGTGIVPAVGTPIGANNWTLDNWGEVLIAVPINGTLFQPIYAWDPLSGAPIASVIPEAPPLNDGAFVAMPQRQIVAWGSTFTGIQDPLLIRWCDVNNYFSWIATVTNQAGSYRLTKGSKIVAGLQGPQQALIWTDIDLWSMQYIAPSGTSAALGYGFNEIGTGCGLIGKKAAASVNGVLYWMGPSQFFTLNADGVQPIPCPVWDVMFQELDLTNTDKIRVAVNSRFNEVAWYYPTLSSGGEVAAYVKYNYVIGLWDYGALARSAWIDQSVLGPPIGADPNRLYIYQHETSPNADGQALVASFQTGYFAINEGDQLSFVDEVWPDFRYGDYGQMQTATLTMTFYVANFPEATPATYGPYTMTAASTWFNTRFRGRLVSFSVMSDDVGSFWRIGRIRYRAQPDGRY